MKKDVKKYYLFEMEMLPLNIVSFLLLIFVGIITYFIDNSFFVSSFYYVMDNFILFFPLMILYMGLHEILHSISYCIYGADFKNIVYGIQLEKGVFYCLCKQHIKRLNILNSLFFPLFYIGIVTYILGIVFELPYLLWLSIFNISGCSGDILMFIYMWKLNRNIEFTELDDCVSFAIYSDNDVSKIKHYGLKYKGSYDNVEICDYKKIKISKFSWIFFFICLILIILMFVN